MVKSTTKVNYLIIGNSAEGIGATEAICEVYKVGSILIISDESYPAYSRPLISEYLGEVRPLEKMLFRPADFYQKNNICSLVGSKVEQLDIDRHTIELIVGTKGDLLSLSSEESAIHLICPDLDRAWILMGGEAIVVRLRESFKPPKAVVAREKVSDAD